MANDAQKGWIGKYRISKTDGTPIDPNAIYFVLRLDRSHAERAAIIEYVDQLWNDPDGNHVLADELIELVRTIEHAQDRTISQDQAEEALARYRYGPAPLLWCLAINEAGIDTFGRPYPAGDLMRMIDGRVIAFETECEAINFEETKYHAVEVDLTHDRYVLWRDLDKEPGIAIQLMAMTKAISIIRTMCPDCDRQNYAPSADAVSQECLICPIVRTFIALRGMREAVEKEGVIDRAARAFVETIEGKAFIENLRHLGIEALP